MQTHTYIETHYQVFQMQFGVLFLYVFICWNSTSFLKSYVCLQLQRQSALLISENCLYTQK